jgi:hypothetical protein
MVIHLSLFPLMTYNSICVILLVIQAFLNTFQFIYFDNDYQFHVAS